MSNVKNIIKYISIAFALVLAVSIVGIMVEVLFSFALGISTETSEVVDRKEVIAFENIREIDIEAGAAQLEVRRDNVDDIIIEYNKDDIKIKEKGNKLEIDDKEGWVGFLNKNTHIVITIPNDMELAKLEISVGAGEASVKGISAEEIQLEVGAGRVTVTDSKFEQAELEVGAGELQFSGILKNAKIENGVGKTVLNIEANRSDYYVKVDNGIGKVSIDGESYDSDDWSKGAENNIKADNGIGKIEINFD